jgi:hypothetical protein
VLPFGGACAVLPFVGMATVRRDWLLVTVHTPGRNSAERVYAWRKLRGLGALYLHQSVCVLPASESTRSAIDTLIEHLQNRGARGEVHLIQFTDQEQEASLIDEFQAERRDEYGEVVERTKQFHEELEYERGRGRVTYPEFEESEADLVRHQKWLAAIEARDYFDAPRHAEAAAAVDACQRALAAFEETALAAEFDEPAGHRERSDARRLRAVDGNG